MLTRRAALLASAAVPFVRPAAAQQPSTLRIAMTLADIPVTDGAPDQGTEGIRFMGYTMYDPLVMWDLSSATEPAKLVPGLATKWYQDPADPTKWIFELRQGVKFHDGSTFNADAVIFSLDRVLDDKSPSFDRLGRSVLIAALWPLVGYRKIDDYKVELQTKGVDTVMPSLLNRFTIASPANFEKVGKDWQAYRKSPSGTGPWKMKAWAPRERAELERNTEYWNKDRIPKTERMVLLPLPDVSTRTAALLSGRVDWIESPAPDSLDKLRAGGCKIETNAIPHMWPYTLSMVSGAPTADIRVRKALNLAVDRDAMVKLLGGLAGPAVGCVPPDHPWFGTPSFKIRYDPAEAKKLMAEAGFANGFDAGLLYCDSSYANMAEISANNLGEIGIRTKLEPIERAGFFAWYASKKYTKGIIQGTSGAFGNAATRLAAFVVKDGAFAYGSYPDIDALYPQQADELDHEKRASMLAKMQQLVHEKAIYAPIWQLGFLNGVGPRVGEAGFGQIPGFAYTAPFEDLTIKS